MHIKTLQAIGPLVLPLALAGCGPKPDDPPTDGEILKAYSSMWTDHAHEFSRPTDAAFDTYLQPYDTHKGDDGITQEGPFGTIHLVTVKFTYRALQPVLYRCDPHNVFAVDIWTANTPTAYPQVDHLVNAGDVFTCNNPVAFTKIKEGWIYSPGNGLQYVIRR